MKKIYSDLSANQGHCLTIATRVYIDGFNLYHGLIQPNQAQWLNLSAFARRLNRGNPIEKIIYCTAMVSGTPNDPLKADRQEGYLRALAIACPEVEIVLGNFSTHRKPYPLAKCKNDPTCAVWVSVRTEKGSDVNLAARLLHDAHLGRFGKAIVVSGDSDLVEPIRLITQELKKKVWVRNPRDKTSVELKGVATDYERIRPAVVLACQLPDTVASGDRSYAKPVRWRNASPSTSKRVINEWTCAQEGCTATVKPFRFD